MCFYFDNHKVIPLSHPTLRRFCARVFAREHTVCVRSITPLGIPPRDKNSFAFHMSALPLLAFHCSYALRLELTHLPDI